MIIQWSSFVSGDFISEVPIPPCIEGLYRAVSLAQGTGRPLATYLRLISAVLMEIGEEWETKRLYLRMENSGLLTQEE